MTDFRINVIVDPRQVPKSRREIERELGLIEQRANRVQSALGRAFSGLSLAFAVREVTRYADSLTNLQNRLRFLVPEQQALVRTTEDLLRVANETRSSFEGTVILYQRLGLATRELGISSDNLLGIVRSINQALILSGASAKEANNGLIQLSQGIAANRLGGDELRSTLEQLPVVADVIARELGVTRGELREIGAEGAITGEVIVRAFQNAAEELDQNFGQTVPTIAQSFTVLQNSLTVFIGTLNTSSGALAALGTLLRLIANNLELIARSLVVAGAAFAALRLAPTIQAFFELQRAAKAGELVILGSAEAARQKAVFDQQQAAAALEAASAETASAQATIASIEADRAAAASTAQRLSLERTKVAISVQAAQASLASAQASVREAEAERANIATTGTLAQVRERALIADASLTAARRNATLAADQLAVAEGRLALATGAAQDAARIAVVDEQRLAAAHTAAADAANAQAAAETRLAGATAAANAQANIFTRTLARARAAVAALTATIAANPIGVLVVLLTTIIASLVVFRDRIRLASDGIATLGDFIAEFIASARAAFLQLVDIFDSVFGGIISRVVELVGKFRISFRSIIEAVAAVADAIIGIVAGIAAFIGSIILDIPGIFARGFELAVNGVITALELIPDTVTALVRTVGQTLDIFFTGLVQSFQLSAEAADQALAGNIEGARTAGKAAAEVLANATERAGRPDLLAERFARNFGEEFEKELIPRLEVTNVTFGEIGSRAAAAFSAGFNADIVSGFVQDLFAGAENRADQRQAAELAQKEAEARAAAAEAAAAQAAEIGKLLRGLRDEQTLLEETINLGQRQAEVNREIREINQSLASQDLAKLSPDQEADVRGLLNVNAALEAQQDILARINPLNNKFNKDLADIQLLFGVGILKIDQYNLALAEIQLEAARAGRTIGDGIKVGLNDALAALFDFSTQTQEIINTTFSEIQDVIALTFEGAIEFIDEFIRNGEVSFSAFRDFLLNIFADALQAIGQQFLQLAAQQATASLAEGFGFSAPETAADQIDVGTQQALLTQRQTIVGQEQTAASTLSKAATGLGTSTTALNGVAAKISTGSGALNKAAVSLLKPSATLSSAAATLAGAIPGLQSAATTLLSAAQLQATAGVAGGAAGGVPAAASGTPAALAGQPILVGEEGPELFTPGQTGAIVPNDQTIGALAEATSNQGQQVVVQPPATPMNVTVVNVTDPNEVTTALSTPGGEQAILNVLSKNRDTLNEFTAS